MSEQPQKQKKAKAKKRQDPTKLIGDALLNEICFKFSNLKLERKTVLPILQNMLKSNMNIIVSGLNDLTNFMGKKTMTKTIESKNVIKIDGKKLESVTYKAKGTRYEKTGVPIQPIKRLIKPTGKRVSKEVVMVLAKVELNLIKAVCDHLKSSRPNQSRITMNDWDNANVKESKLSLFI